MAVTYEELGAKPLSRSQSYSIGRRILNQPNIKKELDRIMSELKNESVATADEVMSYFTSVMRGEVKDQFGLDAPLSERTRAAQEIARRTIDIENRIKENEAKKDEPNIQINLNWDKDSVEIDTT